MEGSGTTNKDKIQSEHNIDIPQCINGLQAGNVQQPCSNKHNNHGCKKEDMLQR